MTIRRRDFLSQASRCAIGAASVGTFAQMYPDSSWVARSNEIRHGSQAIPTFGTIPVVGDGKWIWKDPPKKDRGYLEPRYFDVTTQIKSIGRGPARNVVAATVLPGEFPEQKVVGEAAGKLEGNASALTAQRLADGAQQLVMGINQTGDGQVHVAKSTQRLKVSKSYFGFERDQFPAKQPSRLKALKPFLGSSPGIKVRSAAVSETVKKLVTANSHPWDLAKSFQSWVFENIKGRPQAYTSVETAIKKQVGDCEERAAVFIAFCRSSGIPARLVWIPSHCWAEILLFDSKEKPHWIPVHTAAYSWFGWTGVHEVVLQKGDSIPIPQKRKSVRLVYDHYRCQGKMPKFEFTATIKPVAESTDQDAGPGERIKQVDGKWKLVSKHKADKFHRKD